MMIHNPKVGGSIPPPATNLLLTLQQLTELRPIAVAAAVPDFAEILVRRDKPAWSRE